ncbi:MAG: methylamine dehydrogenase accessory protein MauD [Pseudomonadota bacterium]|jgi:methylamine dehydrogenase accessory protein MauD|nr:methylamine dehydrogenase accessory protein MauD [Pseudomonadota bacterium]MEC7685133.1 methylamine dehydrogenase accessory protein MauD [Pseudomonadota bacterium]MEC8804215.1 methylamine dehydrogenase accessory protein MauD [Pseudomonadota bacterium]|tara:strand:+ start:128 stop:733 length:606 start_codon:yes stop_codon:yes gene_type:complete
MDNYLAEIVILLALVVLVLVIAVFALARQIGVLHTRLAPAGALMTTAGPKVGEPAPLLSIPDLNGTPLELGGTRKLPQLLLFVSPTCPVCQELVPTAKSMARSEKLSLVFGSDGGEVQKHADYVSKMNIEDYPYVVSLELGMKFEVSKLPYAVLIDEQGVLRSKGLVNSREHLESLVESMRSGYESIQDYLVKEELLGEQA